MKTTSTPISGKAPPWSRGIRFGMWVALGLTLLFIAVMALTRLEFSPTPPIYQSTGKLLAGGRIEFGTEESREVMMRENHGTIIEAIDAIGSAAMIHKARERVKSLCPDLKDCAVEISVRRAKGSGIFHVLAAGTEAQYTRSFLDALLDEFIAIHQSIREQARGTALKDFLAEVVAKQQTMEGKSDLFVRWNATHNILTLTNDNTQTAEWLTSLKSQRQSLQVENAELELSLNGKAAQAAEGQSVTQTALRAKQAALRLKLEALDQQISENEKEALKTGALLAEHSRLKAEYESAMQVYEEAFKLGERLYMIFNTNSEYVSLMERASTAIEVTDSNLIPAWKLWSGSAEPAVKEAK